MKRFYYESNKSPACLAMKKRQGKKKKDASRIVWLWWKEPKETAEEGKKKKDAKIERNCVGRRDEETREESLLARLHG